MRLKRRTNKLVHLVALTSLALTFPSTVDSTVSGVSFNLNFTGFRGSLGLC